MRNLTWHLGSIFAVSLLLAGCQSGGSTTAPTHAIDLSGTLPEPSPVAPRKVTDSGDYVHAYTGLVFPAKAGRLTRVDLVETDENRDDVGANYRLPGRDDLDFTALIFPIWSVAAGPLTVEDVPAACKSAYEDAKELAQSRLHNPRIVSEAPPEAQRFPDAAFSQSIVFDADGGTMLADFPIRSELHVQCGVDKVWVVQYRLSYAPGVPDAAELAKAFMATVPALR